MRCYLILQSNKFLNIIGLATRAGKTVCGSEGALSAVRSGKAKLVVLAEDASPTTVKRLTDKCKSFGAPLISAGNKHSLGKITGREQVAVIAVTDSNFAGELNRISEENTGVCKND